MIKETYISIGREGSSLLYEPEAESEKGQIAVLVMHDGGNYLAHPFGKELAKRGYRVLCANTERQGSDLDHKLIDVKNAITMLREKKIVKKIALMGHSGGATLMSAYQAAAENGCSYLRGSEKLSPLSEDVADLPQADGVMLLDANYGNAAMTLFSIDPAVVNEENGIEINKNVDLFEESNGFKKGGSKYSEEFISRFQKAQGERMNRLVDYALERVKLIDSGKGRFLDDEPMFIPGGSQGGFNNKLFAQDIRVFSHTKKEWPLLKKDGETICIVPTVRKPMNDVSYTSYMRGTMMITVKNFLKSHAVRTIDGYGFNEDSISGVDWPCCYASPISNAGAISSPFLMMGMTAGWEFLAAEMIYEKAIKAQDKTLAFVEGASHNFYTAKECEKFPGQFGDTLQTLCNYLDNWLGRKGRFVL
jgi:hypothetical protein